MGNHTEWHDEHGEPIPDDVYDLLEFDRGGVRFHGPFTEPSYRLTVYGYKVPHMRAELLAGTEDHWNLVLDGRFMLPEVSGDEIRRWLPFLANAMAIAAGYSAHGEHARKSNPYKTKLGPLS